ncbi:MAG: hypothetical protein KDA78_20375, partial [Planctomycetaceae bacterium]|nr:hypothetical protein [Planctomycetaceae bacterium]
ILARSAGLNDFRRTAEMIYQLWLASPSYPGMESVHLGWIELLEQQYRKQPSLELLEQYRAGLNEHRTRYAQQKTFPAVVWMSAELARASGDQRSAMQLFYQIPETNPQALNALARIALCWEELLERNPPPADLSSSQREAIQFANQQLQQFNNEWLTSADALELFTLSTRLLLKYETGLHPLLNEQLRKIEEAVSRQSQSQQAADMIALTNLWQRRIRTLQLFLAVQEGRSADVLAMTKSLQEAPHSYDELLVLLESLPESRDPLQRQLSGLVSLRLIQLFHAQESTTGLPKEVQDNLKAREAEAEIALGRISAGVEIYQKLIPGRSASDRLVQRLSTLLKECGNAECHQQRYQLWTGVSQKAQAGSEDWLRARYELADAAWDAGKTEEAQKILQVTQLLYPDAGTPELKLLGQKLEQKLAAGNRK